MGDSTLNTKGFASDLLAAGLSERRGESITGGVAKVDGTATTQEIARLQEGIRDMVSSYGESISNTSRPDHGGQSGNHERMFEKLPTIDGFGFTDRDVSVMERLWEWHERSLKSGRVIGEPSE